MQKHHHLNILGTRGIPASHGGFETFAGVLAQYLVGQGHSVTVYCQSEKGQDLQGREDHWNGIQRVHFGSRYGGPLGTMDYDLKATRHVLNQPGADLVLGYNTALFTALQRMRGRMVYMNMDGIEWKRRKWSAPARAWLKANEWLGARLCNQPIADHPEILEHIRKRTGRRCVMIPYGANKVDHGHPAHLRDLGPGLRPDEYFLSVARIEPENSIYEIVEAHKRSGSQRKLVVLGKMYSDNAYHRRLWQMASEHVLFPGPIYDQARLSSLRLFARAYVHGHQVGGTNPSLVEALGAGNAVLAHDNRFNRWTCGKDQHFFGDVRACANALEMLDRDDLAVQRARVAARARFDARFRWDAILEHYRSLMLDTPAVRIAAE